MLTAADRARATLAARKAAERDQVRARAAAVMAALPSAVARLRDECGATEVWLFGSLANGVLHPASDCDLAVRGIAPDRFVHALALLLWDLPIPCDLVDLDRATPGLVAWVESTGRRL